MATSGFNGRWRLHKIENARDYYAAIKTPNDYHRKMSEMSEAAMKDPHACVLDVTVDNEAKTVEIDVYSHGHKLPDCALYQSGQERDSFHCDGREVKVTFTIESDTRLTRKQVIGDVETDGVFELDGEVLKVTYTCNGVTLTQIFQRA